MNGIRGSLLWSRNAQSLMHCCYGMRSSPLLRIDGFTLMLEHFSVQKMGKGNILDSRTKEDNLPVST